MNLYEASRQWATRPPDQRFWSLEELLRATVNYRKAAAIGRVPMNKLSVIADGDEIALVGHNGHQAHLSNWAFKQLCSRVGAPASYLAELPTALACDNLRHGLNQVADQSQAVILLDQSNSVMSARALLSDHYSRIWNYELVDRLCHIGSEWRVPPARPAFPGQPGARPATSEDILNDRGFGLSVNVGDMIAPAGLYAGPEDMFVFMINEHARIDDGSSEGLSRGFFLQNSEVGKSSLKFVTFYYRHVCGNHIVWSASNVRELRIRHVGTADSRFAHELQIELRKYSDASASDEEEKILHARNYVLAPDKDKILDLIFQKGILSRKQAENAYLIAESNNENPTTAWGFAQGVTRMSQQLVNADLRTEMDRAAGRVIELAF